MFRTMISHVCVTRYWKHLGVILTRNSDILLPVSRFEYFHTVESLHSGNKGSALHVSGDRGQEVFGVLAPYLDISKALQNVSRLEDNISLRKMNLDIKQFSELWYKLESLRSHKDKLEGERTSVASTMKLLGKEKKELDLEKIQKLRAHGKEIREKLKVITKQVLTLEDRVVLLYLKLPNKLHHTACGVDKILISLFSKPCFKFRPEGHEVLGKMRSELEFIECSPTAYYLKGRLAMLELACNGYFSSIFKSHGFISHSNPDFVKGVVVEGSGINISEIEKVFMLSSHNSDGDPNAQYLVGGASVQAFASYFTKQVIDNCECLPQKLLAVGRSYSPVSCKGSGLFSSWQSTVVDGLVLFKNDPVVEETMINEILMAMVQCYTQLKIHFHIKQYGAHNLKPHESAAVGVQIYSPVTDMYWEVGRISVCGDYISKRLLILQKITSNSASFVSMIHVRICNVTRLLALIMENGQNKLGNYDIPDAVNKFMYI